MTKIAGRHLTPVSCRPALSLRREVCPKPCEAFIPPEQRCENRGVGQQDVTGTLPIRGHPEEHVELAIPCLEKRVWLRGVDRLPGKDMDSGRIISGDGVMRQMHMKHKRTDTCQPTTLVQVAIRGKRNSAGRTRMRCRPQTVLVFYRHAQSLHKRTCVLTEALLSRDKRIAVMGIFHRALLQVRRNAYVVMWAKDQAGAFPGEKLT